MDLSRVAVYTICGDFLISLGYSEYPQAERSGAEVMTTTLAAIKMQFED